MTLDLKRIFGTRQAYVKQLKEGQGIDPAVIGTVTGLTVAQIGKL
jgi:hypothetical protein